MSIRSGYNRLWDWFGLSRASFLVLPRSFMHEMPDEWQSKMADLLEEYDSKVKDVDCIDSVYVQAKKDNKFTKIPDWILNYRRPNVDKIRQYVNGNTDNDI